LTGTLEVFVFWAGAIVLATLPVEVSSVSAMSLTSGHILLLARKYGEVGLLASWLGSSSFSVQIAHSEEQAVDHAVQHSPFLVILAGDHHKWSQSLVCQLRTLASNRCMTLIALTDFHAPSWVMQEDNPGFDGFLVNPISNDILFSLVQSAHTRQVCRTV